MERRRCDHPIIVGMNAQGFDVELRAFPDAWRVNFYPRANPHAGIAGSAWETTAPGAAQRAAWDAVARLNATGLDQMLGAASSGRSAGSGSTTSDSIRGY